MRLYSCLRIEFSKLCYFWDDVIHAGKSNVFVLECSSHLLSTIVGMFLDSCKQVLVEQSLLLPSSFGWPARQVICLQQEMASKPCTFECYPRRKQAGSMSSSENAPHSYSLWIFEMFSDIHKQTFVEIPQYVYAGSARPRSWQG